MAISADQIGGGGGGHPVSIVEIIYVHLFYSALKDTNLIGTSYAKEFCAEETRNLQQVSLKQGT